MDKVFHADVLSKLFLIMKNDDIHTLQLSTFKVRYFCLSFQLLMFCLICSHISNENFINNALLRL